MNANDGAKLKFQELASNVHICSVEGHVIASWAKGDAAEHRVADEGNVLLVADNEMSEERSAGRSYIPTDIGTDIDDEDAGVCPDNPEEDADATHHLQVKAICVDEAGEASYLSLDSLASCFSKCGR